MKAEFLVRNEPSKRTIFVTMQGTFSASDMDAWAESFRDEIRYRLAPSGPQGSLREFLEARR